VKTRKTLRQDSTPSAAGLGEGRECGIINALPNLALARGGVILRHVEDLGPKGGTKAPRNYPVADFVISGTGYLVLSHITPF
jgi:hypothetical protein